jgi:SAM-dependent methyltransferase
MEPTIADEDRALFDRIAASYAQKDLRESSRGPRQQRLHQTVKTLGGRLGHVLEVGCGAGFSARYIDGWYDSYTGVDYSSELIRYARQHNGGAGREFVCTDIGDFAPTRRFDVILMVGVLHHIPDAAGALEKLRGLLTGGGAVVVNEPQRGNPAISALRWIRKRVDRDYSSDQVEFSEPELTGLFEEAGYTVESFPQGILSTPFAEARPLPERLSRALSRVATAIDPALERFMTGTFARQLAWNVVVVGRSRG